MITAHPRDAEPHQFRYLTVESAARLPIKMTAAASTGWLRSYHLRRCGCVRWHAWRGLIGLGNSGIIPAKAVWRTSWADLALTGPGGERPGTGAARA